ncbi:MAG: hypothetical protein K0Q71_6016 [Thermomicrobiales bacterium]|jgi:hypothetical protein|nr:hypothetical protein [Thermomicrobiales bacterium]
MTSWTKQSPRMTGIVNDRGGMTLPVRLGEPRGTAGASNPLRDW